MDARRARHVSRRRHTRQPLSIAWARRDDCRRARAQWRPRCRPHPWARRRARVRDERRSARTSRSRRRLHRNRRSLMYPSEILHWIDDAEVASGGSAVIGDSFEKRSPSDDLLIAKIARGSAIDVKRAVDVAVAAADTWGRLPAPKRGEVLGRAAALLRAREREIGEYIQAETGKPWKNAAAEVASSADLAVFMESEGSRLYGRTLPSPIP